MKTTLLTALTTLLLLLTGCTSNEVPANMSKYKLKPDVEFCTITHVNTEHRYAVSRLPNKVPAPKPGDFVMIYQTSRSELRAAFIGVVRSVATDGMTVTFTRGAGKSDIPGIRDLIEVRSVPLTVQELKRKLGAR